MREIKVRGYAVEEMVNSQWIYGTGVHKVVFSEEYAERTGVKEEWFIYTDSGWEMVKPESIGQQTGLKDVNGKETCGGDIVRLFVPTDPEMPEYISAVEDYHGAFAVRCEGMDIYTDYFVLGWFDNYKFEVIGNIYENPELLQ